MASTSPGQLLRRLVGYRHRIRRQLILAQLAWAALVNQAHVQIIIAPDVRFGPRVRFLIERGSRPVIHIGPGSRIFEDVTFQLRDGARLVLGPGVEVRRNTYVNLSGRLECKARNIISYSNVIHCSESIFLDEYASSAEFVSFIDSTHHHDGPSEFFYENASSAPISVGANTWIGNKASVLPGVRIGANSVVASHAVVNRDVPAGVVVGGIPAKYLADRAVDGPALRFFAIS